MPNPLSRDPDLDQRRDRLGQPERLELPLLPTRDLVLFPFMQAPLLVGRELSTQAVQQAENTDDKLIFVCLQRRSDDENPSRVDALWEVGTVATIVRSAKLQDGRLKVWVQGLRRAQVVAVGAGQTALSAQVAIRPDDDEPATEPRLQLASHLLGTQAETAALQRQAREDVERLLREGKLRSQELLPLLDECDEAEPGRFADLLAASMSLPVSDAQALLELRSGRERLYKLAAQIRRASDGASAQPFSGSSAPGSS